MTDQPDREELVARVVAALDTGFANRGEATAIANDIFALRAILGLVSDPTVQRLLERWRAGVDAAYPDILDRSVAYFLRLALYPAPLLGEEMHKLLMLGEDIHVLVALGLPIRPGALTECECALREKVAKEPMLRSVASDLVRPWSSNIWCYVVLSACWGN